MKYRFIEEHRALFPLERMAKVLRVSRSGYHAWLNRPRSRRAQENIRLDVQIKSAYETSKGRYGSMKITRELLNQGWRYSRNRVASGMRRLGIASKTKKKFKATTNSKHSYPVAPNLLNRDFAAAVPNEVWVSDITYIRTKSGWTYLTVFIDLFSRMVTGWAVSRSLNHEMVTKALQMAIWRRRPEKGLMIHSDQGVQYACDGFRNMLKKHHFVQSMSRKGNCWDNAVAESFFKTLKTELIYHVDLHNIHQLKQELFEYIELFYNRKRLHATLDYKTPVDFEQSVYKNCA